jgi:hypothetical protein
MVGIFGPSRNVSVGFQTVTRMSVAGGGWVNGPW